MKKALFYLSAIAFSAAACKRVEHRMKAASGPINTISIIIDDQFWNGAVGDSLRNKFAAPVIGLPQEEPLFTINQYPIRLLEGFTTNARNVIVVKRAQDSSYRCARNEFARPQNVFHLTGRTASGLIALLQKHAPEMVKMMKATEIAQLQHLAKASKENTQIITSQMHLSVSVPSDYRAVLNSPHFIWFKKEITSGHCSLLLYEIPYRAIGADHPETDITRIRDSVGALYIHGASSGAAMKTDDAYAPYFSREQLRDRTILEVRGNWELENDFMSGPFLTFAVPDPARRRYVIIEGFCYAPSERKRDRLTALEAIMQTISFTDNERSQ